MGNALEIFCKNVVALRRRHGLTTEQLREILKLSREAMDAIERGVVTNEVDVETLFFIHRHFGIRPSQIVEAELFAEDGT